MTAIRRITTKDRQPILDLLTTVVRRFVAGQPLFTGDRDHSYDRLAAAGYGAGRIVAIFVVAQIVWVAAILIPARVIGDLAAVLAAVVLGGLVGVVAGYRSREPLG